MNFKQIQNASSRVFTSMKQMLKIFKALFDMLPFQINPHAQEYQRSNFFEPD